MARQFKGVWIPAELYLDKSITWTQKIILLEVDSFSKNNLECFVSNEHLANLIGISESGIEKAIRGLVQMNRLERKRQVINGVNRRLMSLPTSLECDTLPHSTEGTNRTQVRNTINNNYKQVPKPKKGRPQSFDEVWNYFKEIELNLDEAQKFVDWYDSVGWKVKGGNPIKDWKACARQWKRRNKQNTQMQKKDLAQITSHLMPSTISLITDSGLMVKPREAWTEGTNIRTAVKHNPEIVRGWIMAEVGRLIKDVDANKTISSDEELQFCCRSILDEHPTLKLEELRACFNMVRQGKFGKLFERLKSAEILEFIRQYEGEVRTEVMKRLREEERNQRFETPEKLEPLNLSKRLADILNDDTPLPKPKGQGLGARLKKRLGTND